MIVSEENMPLIVHKQSVCLISQCMHMPVQILNGSSLNDPVSIQTGLLSVRQPNAILWRLDGGSIVADFVPYWDTVHYYKTCNVTPMEEADFVSLLGHDALL